MLALALTLLLATGVGDGPGGDGADGDTVTLSRAEYDALVQRVARIEALLGPDAETLANVRALGARLDAVEASSGGARVSYKGGLRIEDPDAGVKLQLGGRIHFVVTSGSGDSDLDMQVGSLEDGAHFRRARWKAKGSFGDQLDFAAQYDFTGGEATFKDLYLKFKDVPVVGNLKVGHFKEPNSLEQQTSAASQPLIERSAVTALTYSENSGLVTQHTSASGRLQGALGVFRDDVDRQGADTGDGEYAVTARVTGLPVHDPRGERNGGTPRFVHLGAWATRRSVDGGEISFDSDPEARKLPDFVDTGDFAAETVDAGGLEAAWVEGPLWVQAEVVRTHVESDEGGDPDFQGHYVLVAYFLTGESQPYDTRKGGMGRVKPKDPFLKPGGSRGIGAWQLAVRRTVLDLTDGSIDGGRLENTAFGVNWLLDDTTRIMANYIRSHLDATPYGGRGDIVMVAFQKDF